MRRIALLCLVIITAAGCAGLSPRGHSEERNTAMTHLDNSKLIGAPELREDLF